LSAKRSTSCENGRVVHISPDNYGTLLVAKKVQLTQIENQAWAFQ